MKLLTPKQTSRCANCTLVITERKRKPCPRCGSMSRHIERFTNENLGASDRAS